MTVSDILKIPDFIGETFESDRDVTGIFCCDLLSVAMARAPENSAWVTVIGNKNAIAVATLAEVSCIVIAEGYSFDEEAVEAAKGKITLLKTPLPIFEAAQKIGSML